MAPPKMAALYPCPYCRNLAAIESREGNSGAGPRIILIVAAAACLALSPVLCCLVPLACLLLLWLFLVPDRRFPVRACQACGHKWRV